MDKLFTVVTNNFENKYVKEKRIDIAFSDEKYEELREIAIEVDDTIEEIIECIVEKDLIEKIDDENFKQLVMDAYYSDMFV